MLELDKSDQLIDAYLAYILEANQRINLTRITDLDTAKILHVEDSLVPLQDIISAPEGLYGDMGTGGGFPGVPIAVKSGRKAVLIDLLF